MNPVFRAKAAVLSVFKHPFTFEIPNNAKSVIYGPEKRSLLEIIAGKVSDPSKSISFPAFGRDLWPSQAIQFVSFGQSSSSSAQAPFVGARYESFRDEFDASLRNFLQSRAPGSSVEEVRTVAKQLNIESLLDNWVVGLSNGQSRRAQLALALLRHPQLLVMDEPFLGLDPANRSMFSDILSSLSMPVVIGLRSGEPTPAWIQQTLFATTSGVFEGTKAQEMIETSGKETKAEEQRRDESQNRRKHRKVISNKPAVELRGLTIAYKGSEKPLFQDLSFTINEGERVHIKGANGSGKSTLLALLTADHPQSWNERVVLFGEPREVGKHSYFGINKAIGHTSPEIHAIFPRHLTTRRAISTGFSQTMIPPSLDAAKEAQIERVAAQLGLDIASELKFGDMSLAEQKLILFARALVKEPKLLILDEAFSTLSPSQIATVFDVLDNYDGTVIVVGHVADEVPACDKVMELQSN